MSELSKDASPAERAVAAIRAGEPVVLPTDTVYGLCATPFEPDPVRRMYELKGREEQQPTAILFSGIDHLLELLPELPGRVEPILQALLPAPITLVLPNPARRFPWLSGARPETIGARVPELTGEARTILETLGAVAATSANLKGGPDPKRLDEVPKEIRAGAVLVDGGELPGIASTVVDLTVPEPQVLREGAVSAAEVLERLGQLA